MHGMWSRCVFGHSGKNANGLLAHKSSQVHTCVMRRRQNCRGALLVPGKTASMWWWFRVEKQNNAAACRVDVAYPLSAQNHFLGTHSPLAPPTLHWPRFWMRACTCASFTTMHVSVCVGLYVMEWKERKISTYFQPNYFQCQPISRPLFMTENKCLAAAGGFLQGKTLCVLHSAS